MISGDPTKLSEFQANTEYSKARKEFAAHIIHARHVSIDTTGIPSRTAQHYWASVLFTRMVVTAMSIEVLTPEIKPDAHWDFSAVASITRNLAECYLFFYFLCADDVSDVEKDGRIILLNLHDNASRRRLFGELGETADDAETAAAKVRVHDDLVRKFNANTYLASLPDKRKKELIRGEKTPFVQDEIIERAKMDKRNFRFLYRLFSNHTHTGPIAFYRMAEHGRGRGIQNRHDTFYIAMALSFASDLIQLATADFLALFPETELRGTAPKMVERNALKVLGRREKFRKRR